MRLPWWIWTTAAGLIIGAALYFSTAARADVDDYVSTNARMVCTQLDHNPTYAGILNIGEYLVTVPGFTSEEAGVVIAHSVLTVCPEHRKLLEEFAETYAPKTRPSGAIGGRVR